jgi:uncharacterized cofD-like protein
MSEAKRKIVTIGGGTGTFVVLSGLKHLENVRLTAIVSVVDDGGSTGRLRDAYGFLPPGDARQALVALADDADGGLIRQLFSYRFTKGDIAGHNLGNLLLTGLSDILGSGADAIDAASKTLRIKGRVVPVSTTPATLIAKLEDGQVLVGEHVIDERISGRPHIVELSTKENVEANPVALESIKSAKVIVLGPGDLYASTLADFAVKGIPEAVRSSKAKIIYIVNLFTKAGQTDGLSASHHVAEIERHVGRKPDAILVHSGEFAAEVLARYAKEHEYPVMDDLPESDHIIRGQFADVVIAEKIEGDTVPRSLIRHSSARIASAIEKLL